MKETRFLRYLFILTHNPGRRSRTRLFHVFSFIKLHALGRQRPTDRPTDRALRPRFHRSDTRHIDLDPLPIHTIHTLVHVCQYSARTRLIECFLPTPTRSSRDSSMGVVRAWPHAWGVQACSRRYFVCGTRLQNSTRVATFLATVIAKFHARKPVVYHDRRVGIGPGALVDQAARAQGEGLRRAIHTKTSST